MRSITGPALTSLFEAASRSGKLAQFAYLARNVKVDTLATAATPLRRTSTTPVAAQLDRPLLLIHNMS